jgi:hypothetical protein
VASALESENYAVLVQKRKLSLVLDLDNTLICATQVRYLAPPLLLNTAGYLVLRFCLAGYACAAASARISGGSAHSL